MAEAARVLDVLGYEHEEFLFGGAAIDAVGDALPEETLVAAREADAVLLGAVGGPKWKPGAAEKGLLDLRAELAVYANLRPAGHLLIVRELIGGLYFGWRGTRDDGTVFDTCEYTPNQVARVAKRAFEIARTRQRKLLSVDKANVMETGRLWRRVVTELGHEYPDVELKHGLVDSVAMWLVMNPDEFDVLVTENTFGDILSDVAAGVFGGLGLAASASLGDGTLGVYEPVHGSAPDIAGTGSANPTAMLRSLAMALEHSLGVHDEARALEAAVDAALASAPTPDVGGTATTREFGDAVLSSLRVTV
ncbi:MAG: 3-isopropylmalate dehydrogenase [Actinobacteria bacterium]|nr:3-isopropylmalate dehydrogenase [Actinomycetota bacterium]